MKIFLRNYRNGLCYLMVAAVVAVIGTALLLVGRAQTPTASLEVENGMVTSPASTVSDSVASGGRAVRFNAPPSTRGGCTVDILMVNSCRPWLGAYSNKHGEVAGDLKSQLLYHESLIGRQVDVVHDYAREGNVLSSFDIYAATRPNSILFLNYKPAVNWAAADGSDATVNTEIDKMAFSIKKNLGSKKMFMTIWHEPENDLGSDSNCPKTSFKGPAVNTIDAYKAMWQNVQNRFKADGVTNVVWAMDYMNYPAWSCVVPDLYPGDSLVDWIVFNGYAQGAGNWDSVVSRFYNYLLNNSNSTHNYLSKPWGIVEWGIMRSTQAEAYSYYDQVKASLDASTFPKLKLYMIFDSIGPPDYTPGGQIETGSDLVYDQTEVNHYKAFANDPKLLGSWPGN